MKLPQERNDRIKIGILIAAGGILAAYGLVTFAVKPLLHASQARHERIALLQENLEKARVQIAQMQKGKAGNAQVIADLARLSGDGGMILNPRMGNYVLGAQEFIAQCAQNCGLTVDSVRELGLSGIQPAEAETKGAKAKPAKQVFQAYTAVASLICGMHDLVRLLNAIETANPYVCVSSVDISLQAATPDKHAVTFQVQWPVWASEDQKSRIEQQSATLGGL